MSAESVRRMYAMGPDDRDARARIMGSNFKRSVLENFIRAPAFAYTDVEHFLNDLTRATIEIHRMNAREAGLTEEQSLDFETKLDNWAADAVLVIRGLYQEPDNRFDPAFQIVAAQRLGLPIEQ